VTQAAVAALVLTGSAHIPVLVVLSALNGALAAISLPASAALTPQTVPADVRQAAIAVLRIGANGTMIVGAAAGGALVAAIGPGWGLAVDAATFLVAGLVFSGVRVPPVASGQSGTSIVTDLREGWGEFTARTWVWVVVAAFTLINACFGAMQVLGPAVADRTIGRGGWGLVLASETVGMVVGGLFALRSRSRRPLLAAMVWVSAIPILVATLGVAPYLPLLLAVGVLCGVGAEQFGVAWETTLQQHIPPDRLARVYSYDMLGSYLAIPVGEVVAGPIAGEVGTTATLLGAAGIALLATVAAAATPSVRGLRRQPIGQPGPVDPGPADVRAHLPQ
jgi:MFS family permease